MISLLSRAKTVAKDLLQSRHWHERPQTVNVEVTAACDAKCIHCPRLDMDRPMKAMKMELFKKLVDQAADLGVPYFCPNGYGEICTIPMPALEEYFGCIAARGNPFKILINTNGNRMFEDRAKLFVQHQVHLVNVTIDGATAATAESIRVNLHFDQIEANVKKLIEVRNAAGLHHPKVRVGMIAMPQTVPEIEMFKKRWEGQVDFVGMGGFSTRLTSVEKATADTHAAYPTAQPATSPSPPDLVQLGLPSKPAAAPPKVSACVLPFRDINIWADGKAVLCCEDWNEEYVVGDLNEQSLDEIWHGERFAEVRRKHVAKLGHEISLCGRCNAWQAPSAGARLWS